MRRALSPPIAHLVLFLSVSLAGSTAAADRFEPREVAVGSGVFDLLAPEGRPGEADLEIRFPRFGVALGRLAFELEPAVGAMANADGGVYAYVGGRLPFELTPRWSAAISTGVGIYSAGEEGKDLGGPVQFRSGAELVWGISERSRIGLGFYHLSNSRLYDVNPGSESLVAFYSVRLGG